MTITTVVEREILAPGFRRFERVMEQMVVIRAKSDTTTTTTVPVCFSLTYEAVHADVERFIASVAQTYTDVSCPQLHFDEIVAECRAKTAKLVNDGWLEKVHSRTEFFRVFATAIKNHVCSLVLKFRYTEKRTGVKPPPRRKRTDILNGTADQHEHRKNVEVSFDDPDAGLQVPDAGHRGEGDMAELVEEFRTLLTPVEQLVFGQLIEPNLLALMTAQVDASHGKSAGSVRIKIKNEHLACGIGLSTDLFENAVLTIREKIRAYRLMSEDQHEQDTRFNAAVQTLCEIFQVQIPKSQFVDDILIKRLFTIAARAEYHKVNSQVAQLLTDIGAMVPETTGTVLRCFGVLHNRNDQRCIACGVKLSCATTAASFGLDKINPSPKLLGHRMTRIPAIMPVLTDAPSRPALQPTTAVADYLNDTFTRFDEAKGIFYGHKGATTSSLKRLFCVETEAPFTLRFCGPSPELKDALNRQGKCYYLPHNLTFDESVNLIEQHVKETVWPTMPPTSKPLALKS